MANWLALESSEWQPSYRDMPQLVRQSVVDALCEAQRGLCVYCGRRLERSRPGKSFHVEHFRPQGAYPKFSTQLSNLFLSCGQESAEGNRSETCGTAKDDWFDEGSHIEPDYPDCTNRFRFLLTGKIAPAVEPDAAAVKAIEKLNLDHPELRKDRRDILERIDGETLDLSDFVDSTGKPAQSYAHVVCQRFGAVIP